MTNLQRAALGAAMVMAFTIVGQAGQNPAASQPPPSPPPPGDAARGKVVVESGGCLDCHRIGDRGSHLGPELTDIGDRRQPERLMQALVAPDDEVLPENRFARIVLKDGTTVTGRLLNQDAIGVQIINAREELKTYLRANMRQYAIVDKGLMPTSQGKLSAQQIADVVNYLLSLREK